MMVPFSLRRALLLAALWLAFGFMFAGCAPKPEILTVVVTPDPPPIPHECKALATELRMPRLPEKDADGQPGVPMSRLEDGWLETRINLKADALTKRRCLCWLVAAHGSESDIRETANVCREGLPIM